MALYHPTPPRVQLTAGVKEQPPPRVPGYLHRQSQTSGPCEGLFTSQLHTFSYFEFTGRLGVYYVEILRRQQRRFLFANISESFVIQCSVFIGRVIFFNIGKLQTCVCCVLILSWNRTII